MLRAGTPAPPFEARDQHGALRTLEEFRGRHVALFFYPRDDTPGCKAEACGFRDRMDELTRAGVQVLGVSTQDEASHARFAEKNGLPYPLLADPGKNLCRAYEALGLLGMAKRVTYLIGPDGTIVRAWAHVSPMGHAREVLDAVPRGRVA